MGKHRDLTEILLVVIIGMFIPFLFSIVIVFGLDFRNLNDLWKIASTFGWFLLIFAIELVIVYLYFTFSNKYAERKLKKYKP